jgi:hypothetical protein
MSRPRSNTRSSYRTGNTSPESVIQTNTMKRYGEVDRYVHIFLTSAIVGSSEVHASVVSPPGLHHPESIG